MGAQEYRPVDAAEIGKRLREARLAAGLSQRSLAFPGCTAAYVSRLEDGQRVPSGHLLDELARRLGTTREWLEHGSRDLVVRIPADVVDDVVGWIREGLNDVRRGRDSLGLLDDLLLDTVRHLLPAEDQALVDEIREASTVQPS